MQPEISYIFFKESLDEQELITIISNLNGFICILNPDALTSEIQILAAYDHVYRDNEVRRRVRDGSLRLMIHLTGERQIKNARKEIGFRNGLERCVVVYEDASVFQEFLSGLRNAVVSDRPFIPHDNPELDRSVFPRMAMSDFLS